MYRKKRTGSVAQEVEWQMARLQRSEAWKEARIPSQYDPNNPLQPESDMEIDELLRELSSGRSSGEY